MDKPRDEATLVGKAQALRESLEGSHLPPEQAEFDQALTHLAESIDEAERDAAMAEGKQMSLDEAVSFALEEAS